MPKFEFYGVGRLQRRRMQPLFVHLSTWHDARDTLLVFHHPKMQWAVKKNEPTLHVRIDATGVAFWDAFSLAQVCARYLDVELVLDSGRELFYPKGSTLPTVFRLKGENIFCVEGPTSQWRELVKAARAIVGDANVRISTTDGPDQVSIDRGAFIPLDLKRPSLPSMIR